MISRLPAPVASPPAVAIRIADFLVRSHAERLDLFRMHLRATVRLASPLLLDLAEHEGIDLQAATGLIQPPSDWPWRPIEHNLFIPLSRTIQRKSMQRGSAANVIRAFDRAFEHPGVVIRGVAHPRGRFGIRPTASVLAFSAAIGPCLLSSFGTSASLKFADPIPDSLMMSMPGRPLDDVVMHPVFVGRGYVIRRAFPDPADGAPILEFRTPLTDFDMALGEVRP